MGQLAAFQPTNCVFNYVPSSRSDFVQENAEL